VSEATPISESVLRDFKGLRHHVRIGGDANPLDHQFRPLRANEEQISPGEAKRFAKDPLRR
jgi:hypothetical protein